MPKIHPATKFRHIRKFNLRTRLIYSLFLFYGLFLYLYLYLYLYLSAFFLYNIKKRGYKKRDISELNFFAPFFLFRPFYSFAPFFLYYIKKRGKSNHIKKGQYYIYIKKGTKSKDLKNSLY